MSARHVRISAHVSPETKVRLERFAQASGLNEARIIESALDHYLLALDALPADVVVPPRVVVDRETGERLLERIARPAEPTEAMRELFEE